MQTSVGEGVPQGGDRRGELLQLAQEVRGSGGVADDPKAAWPTGCASSRRTQAAVADLSLDKAMLQNVVSRHLWSAPRSQGLSVIRPGRFA